MQTTLKKHRVIRKF